MENFQSIFKLAKLEGLYKKNKAKMLRPDRMQQSSIGTWFAVVIAADKKATRISLKGDSQLKLI